MIGSHSYSPIPQRLPAQEPPGYLAHLSIRNRISTVCCSLTFHDCIGLFSSNIPTIVNPQNPDNEHSEGSSKLVQYPSPPPYPLLVYQNPGWSQAIPTCFTSIRAAAPCSRAIRATMDSAFWRAMPWEPMSICWSDLLSCSSWRTRKATCFRGLQWMDLQ